MPKANESGTARDLRSMPRIDPGSLDRRASPRFTVLDHRGWIGWWSRKGFEVVAAHLLDLSRGGAALEMDEKLEESQMALLGLEELREAGCLEVSVVRVTRGRRRRYRVQVAFTEPCLDDLYAAALQGIKRDNPTR